jgi:signal transduction histidine kinase
MAKPVIICVDDESIILDSLTEQLSRTVNSDYDIETAESGAEALELIEELNDEGIEIPIMISDYIMPGIKGDELLEKVHEISPKTLNILLTGQASIDGIGNAINKGNLYRFIPKPWDSNDLALTVSEALKSYNNAAKLEKRTNELEELTKTLELKVEERTEELQVANKTKDKFFSIIAHDLKNPFNYLIGMTGIINEYMDSMEPEELKDLIGKLQESAKNAFNLLQNLLDWARSQRDALQMNPGAVSVNLIVTNSITPLLDLALEKDIVISNKIDTQSKVMVDEYMITTVVRNIVSNAIKYTRNNGEVTFTSTEQDGMMIISVQDTGVGIPEDILNKLFKIGENVTIKGTNDEAGTGLGLILCAEFIHKHKGKIWAESREGEGSTFHFSIPIAK